MQDSPYTYLSALAVPLSGWGALQYEPQKTQKADMKKKI